MAKFGKDMLTYAGADLLGSSIGLILSPIFTRLFTPAQYGAQAALAAVWGFVALAQYGGMDSAYPVFRSRTEEAAARLRLRVTATLVALGSALIVSGAFVALGAGSGALQAFADVGTREMVAFGATLLPAAAMSWFLYLLRYERAAAAFARVSLLGRFVGALVLVPVLYGVAQPERMAAGYWVTAAVTTLAAYLGWRELARAGFPAHVRGGFAAADARTMLGFGLALMPGYLVYACTAALDRLLVTWLAGPEETAVLALALRLAMAATMLRTWFALVWDPQAIEWIARLPEAELMQRLNVAARGVALAGAFLTLGAAFWCEPVLQLLYPREYWASARLLPWVVAGAACASLSLIAVLTTTRAKVSHWHLPVYGLGLAINAGLAWWWIPQHGAVGAVIGTAGGEAAILAGWIVLGRWRLANLPVAWLGPLALLTIGVLLALWYRPGVVLPEHVLVERALLTLVAGAVLVGPLMRLWRDLRRKGEADA